MVRRIPDLGPMHAPQLAPNIVTILMAAFPGRRSHEFGETCPAKERQMRIATFASIAALSMIMASSPLTTTGFDIAAMAKGGGNGGGNGGGSGEGNGGGSGSGSGNGGGNGGGQSGSHENRGHQSGNSQPGSSQTGKSSRDGSKSGSGAKGKSGEAKVKSLSAKNAAADIRQRNVASELAGLNSLNRSYKAYMHTSDPRMTAIAAYAMAYARFELDNGIEPAIDDPVLGDAALEDALAAATRSGEVSPAAFDEAKTILGVGEADGKIDQIRESLSYSAPTSTGN
jgi:hypothetical protein